jgi:non-homologous end joining protein Ku
MAPRPSWRGYLRLSLVTCPVAVRGELCFRDTDWRHRRQAHSIG